MILIKEKKFITSYHKTFKIRMYLVTISMIKGGGSTDNLVFPIL